MKTAELTGALLAEWVARANGWRVMRDGDGPEAEMACWEPNGFAHSFGKYGYRPDLNWGEGGPIIEREKIHLYPHGGQWRAFRGSGYYGETALIAAMRTYVASRFGSELREGGL